jgi:hypothetical protein
MEGGKLSGQYLGTFIGAPAEDVLDVDNFNSFLRSSLSEKIVDDFEPRGIENDSEVQDDNLVRLNQSLDKRVYR